jgi:DNA-binding SARP family transcriptional activator
MEFRILGPVEIQGDAGLIELSASKVRTVLASLLLARGRVVSDSRLATVLWGEDPPATADAQIQTYVSRLRQRLGAAVRIARQRPGYLLRIAADQLDLVTFEQLAASGHDALVAGRYAEASDTLKHASAIWRGPALGGVTEFLSDLELPRLEEARLTVLEDRVDADLALGLHTTLVAELTGLVAGQPLRERARAQLMITLHRCGRQPDALASYHDYRRLLVAELGIDPGPDLQELHQAILAGDPTLDVQPVGGPVPADRPPLDTQRAPLPPDIANFTGRDKQVAEIVTSVRSSTTVSHGRRVAHLITGMAGVGKTALAVHAAHRLAGDFPDGQIYVDLDAAGPTPADALTLLLPALGVAGSAMPSSVDHRTELYNSRLARRSVLVVLDNVKRAEQVRPLLPADPHCAALLVGRTRLTALEGVRMTDVGVLTHSRSLELLAKVVDRGRVAAEPEAAARIVRQCGYLPLALRIAGARLAAKPHWQLSRMAALLSNGRQLLDELCHADLEVRASVAGSLTDLAEPARRALRLLALPNIPRFTSWAAAVVLDVPLVIAHDLLEQLVDARLLEATWLPGTNQINYAFHNIVRLFARECALREETAEARYAALNRAFGNWPSARDHRLGQPQAVGETSRPAATRY